MHDWLGSCGPLLAQLSRFSSSNRYWLKSPVPVSCVAFPRRRGTPYFLVEHASGVPFRLRAD
jgi:hypothetical protein